MNNLKKIELLGNVASCQEADGKIRVRMVVSEWKGTENGEAKYETTWAAMFLDKEIAAKYNVGDFICVHGGFNLGTYTATVAGTNKKETRISLTVYPDSIRILSKKKQETNDLPEGDMPNNNEFN